MLRRMPADDLDEELRLARRELKLVRGEQEHLSEQLQQVRRQRSRLKEQAEVTAEALAALLSEAYWRSTETRLFGRRSDEVPSASEQEMVREVEASALFDAAWYLRQNLDVARDRLSPAAHYVRTGGPAGRDPSEVFATKRFLQRTPAARASGLPPLVHHLRHPEADQTDQPTEPASASASDIHL